MNAYTAINHGGLRYRPVGSTQRQTTAIRADAAPPPCQLQAAAILEKLTRSGPARKLRTCVKKAENFRQSFAACRITDNRGKKGKEFAAHIAEEIIRRINCS